MSETWKYYKKKLKIDKKVHALPYNVNTITFSEKNKHLNRNFYPVSESDLWYLLPYGPFEITLP